MAFKGWGEEDDISISESIVKVKFLIASEDDI